MHSFTRQYLLRLAECGLFTPVWSENIAQEWKRNAPRIWKTSRDVVETVWHEMEKRFPDANMGEILLEENTWKKMDKKDRHIAMCAYLAQQRFQATEHTLLTWNIQDFHRKTLRDCGIDLKTPDQLLHHYWLSHPSLMNEVLHQTYEEHLALGLRSYTLKEMLKRDKLFLVAKHLPSTIISS